MQKKPTTQLGRCCIQAVDGQVNTLRRHKQHRTKNSLRDVILGGQDGPPSIGGTYDLLGQDGTALYRVNIPVTALPEHWQARPAQD